MGATPAGKGYGASKEEINNPQKGMKRSTARATNNGAKNADKRKYKTRNVHKSNFQTTRARRAKQREREKERRKRERAGERQTSNNKKRRKRSRSTRQVER